VAVLVTDLDQFKLVNDSFGHPAGDELLIEVARRWQALLRPSDTLARLGGDEFVIVCDGADETVAHAVAERVLASLEAPIVLAGRSVAITASVGIALASSDSRMDAATLLRHGDAAMYEAKSQGRGRTAVFTPRLADQARNRLELFHDLQAALAEGVLELAYQPVMDLATGTIQGVEALCRWTHPVRGPIAPDEFIPVAEETGLIEKLDRWVMSRACSDAAALRAGGTLPADAYMAVNVSAGHLAQPGFEASVRAAVREAGLPATALVLEVTESAVMRDPDAARVTLESLRALGVRVSIDDFGTGYSSLAYLRRLPVSSLKIDRSFVRHLSDNADDRAIVTAVIDLARALNITTTAEGIETDSDLALLRRLGCTAGQGYLWSPAVPLARLEHLLEALVMEHFTPLATGAQA
jgi:diguanylate cyclase (GGDEF)-like protein